MKLPKPGRWTQTSTWMCVAEDRTLGCTILILDVWLLKVLGYLAASILRKSGGKAEGRREALTAACEDNVLPVLNCLVQIWENWKNKISRFFCPWLGWSLRWYCNKLFVLWFVFFLFFKNLFLSGTVRSKLICRMISNGHFTEISLCTCFPANPNMTWKA